MKRCLAALLAACLALTSCSRRSADTSAAREVILYSSLDEPYLRPILKAFEEQTHIHVTLVTDTEATKTAGLAERVEAERDRPRADVYWGNEPFHTVRLAAAGCFEPYRPATANDVPARWRDKSDLWLATGLRVRMIAVSTRKENADAVKNVKGLADLGRPELKGRIGICNPGFGTASGHIAALFVTLGKDRFTDLMRAWRANDIKLLGGNSVVADQVAGGNLVAGPTDNDDIANGKADGQAIDGILPDQDSFGTLLVPTTVALIKNRPHPDEAKTLVDYIARPEVERELIADKFAAYSVRQPPQQGGPKTMDVDYATLAQHMPEAVGLALTILQDRK